jgi:glycosyltransferase involved in cell wall biosynthesis
MLGDRVPYHCAVLRETFRGAHLSHLRDYDGAVYANFGHWGTLLASPSPQWVLDQQNADVQFWEAYIAYSRGLRKLAAFINWRLASHHFPSVYRNVGRIICVSETDRQLTLQIAPQALVDVVENGVDCSYLTPGARLDSHLPRLLFTGTSAARNVKALADFVDEVYPRIRAQRPGAELCVAGNFAARAQERFADVDGLWFTGAVPDLRPYFDPNDVFIAPFNETHGSKLKVAEAMAMGMAIVATPEGAQGMPVMNGCNAIIANGVDEFADRCCELLSDEALRRRLGRQARQTALERLDWPVLGERLRQMIDEVQLRERAIR